MSKNKKFQKNLKAEKGITLIALVITIVILIILATVSINVVLGEGGLIQRAQEGKSLTEQAQTDEQEELTGAEEYINGILVGIEDQNPPAPQTPKVEDVKGGEAFNEKTKVVDSKNNKIWVPAGFKIASDSGDTVQQGIVIEDVNASKDTAVQGSQYVWIPVGTFTKDDGSTSGEIKLGRYTFSTSSPGTPTLVQDAANYTDQSESVVIESKFKELVDYRPGVSSDGTDGKNATAKDLKGFINSVSSNGGYYIGRYEASYASGSSTADYKAASKISTGKSTSSMSYTPGTLWNFITQLDASKVAINTYDGNASVKSDLINSYAWDTAIVYIQEAGNSNYANQKSKNRSLANTGKNSDEVCKINDMASNIYEWTTEYSSYTYSGEANPCTHRGGNYVLQLRLHGLPLRQHCDYRRQQHWFPSQLVFVELRADRKVEQKE